MARLASLEPLWAKRLVRGPGGVAHVGQHATVDVGREARVGAPEELLGELNVHTLLE